MNLTRRVIIAIAGCCAAVSVWAQPVGPLIPADETRAVVRVSLAAGRAYSGYRQPLLVNYSGRVDMNVRAFGVRGAQLKRQ